ncbi:ribosome small subunit-dependent GTPase A [Actinomadura sp. WAC 06369]|uniref:ribosome small subunit-dependent GTPase A n=1 Tax=Actinomadura sp. WAC 06369 TaxID=2203193 RepID=UPI000F768257|nr:ribosome small subunit-dependent GTPase A [Actinomadura sp. WAC 06369]RSN41627.1 ribosome small subunit-dependent GTPase A [Actinomadura sp. WAC 06369]
MSHFSGGSPLSAYGWDETLEDDFSVHLAAGLAPARVVAVHRGLCEVVTADGPVLAVTPRAGRPDPVAAPCTGDWAALRPAAGPAPRTPAPDTEAASGAESAGAGGRPVLAALLPRRTAIVRAGASRDSRGQVLAANVDTVAVAVSMAARPSPGRLERLLALAFESGARPVVVLTKADRADPADVAAAEADAAAAAPGVDVVSCSALAGDGVDVVRAVLTGTVVLLGPSGAGKSTLGNALLGDALLATGAVRDGDGKGRHTTVRRELVPLPGGGVLIDTPGLRGVGLLDAEEGLRRTFSDVEELAERCRFGDCAHESEPGCAVLAAVQDGSLPHRRLDGYRKLMRESAWAAARSDARLRAEREGRRKAISRWQRQMYKERGRDR